MMPYQKDLAYIQAVAFGGFARGVMPAIIERLCTSRVAVHRVIDVGCGAGVSTRSLLDAGFDALAIEPSEALLAVARDTAPGARFEPASVYDVTLDAPTQEPSSAARVRCIECPAPSRPR